MSSTGVDFVKPSIISRRHLNCRCDIGATLRGGPQAAHDFPQIKRRRRERWMLSTRPSPARIVNLPVVGVPWPSDYPARPCLSASRFFAKAIGPAGISLDLASMAIGANTCRCSQPWEPRPRGVSRTRAAQSAKIHRERIPPRPKMLSLTPTPPGQNSPTPFCAPPCRNRR